MGVTTWLEDEPLLCVLCGRGLNGDIDEDATGEGGLPICGECYREREFFEMDAADGELDGEIGG